MQFIAVLEMYDIDILYASVPILSLRYSNIIRIIFRQYCNIDINII